MPPPSVRKRLWSRLQSRATGGLLNPEFRLSQVSHLVIVSAAGVKAYSLSFWPAIIEPASGEVVKLQVSVERTQISKVTHPGAWSLAFSSPLTHRSTAPSTSRSDIL